MFTTYILFFLYENLDYAQYCIISYGNILVDIDMITPTVVIFELSIKIVHDLKTQKLEDLYSIIPLLCLNTHIQQPIDECYYARLLGQ